MVSVCTKIIHMAKKRVNFTIDYDYYERFRELLSELPTKPSVSFMMNEFIKGMVEYLEPTVDALSSADSGDRIRALKGIHADMLINATRELGDTVHTIEKGARKQQ